MQEKIDSYVREHFLHMPVENIYMCRNISCTCRKKHLYVQEMFMQGERSMCRNISCTCRKKIYMCRNISSMCRKKLKCAGDIPARVGSMFPAHAGKINMCRNISYMCRKKYSVQEIQCYGFISVPLE